jgi:hypothetical protein
VTADQADDLYGRTPQPQFAALARMLGWSKLETTGSAALHENIQNLQCFRA